MLISNQYHLKSSTITKNLQSTFIYVLVIIGTPSTHWYSVLGLPLKKDFLMMMLMVRINVFKSGV